MTEAEFQPLFLYKNFSLKNGRIRPKILSIG